MDSIEEIKKITPIGFDHGWNFCKTRHTSFLSGLREITTTPALFDNVLEYGGKYYKIGTKRMEVRENKVSDDSFYLLTLSFLLRLIIAAIKGIYIYLLGIYKSQEDIKQFGIELCTATLV